MKAGIHTLAAADYHADPCDVPSLSSGIANLLIAASPIHAWAAHPRLNPECSQTSAAHFDVGSCAHALILEGLEIVEVVDAPDWRTAAAKAARDSARADGKYPLLTHEWVGVQAMVQAARIQLQAVNTDPPLFALDGQPEQTLVWEEEGVWCRARPDWLHDSHLAVDDYKTTSRTANPEAWSRTLFSMGYDVQAAFYMRGLRALTGKDAEWRWVVQETTPPYALSVVSLTPAARELADAKVSYAIRLWRECVTSSVWPGYPTDICYAELPGWEETRWLEKEEREKSVV